MTKPSGQRGFDERQAQRLQNVVTLAGAVGAAPLGALVGALASGLYARRTSTSWEAALQGGVTGLFAGAVLGGLRGRIIGTLAAMAQETRSSQPPRGPADP
jgi:membrane associated rhomboid family serine protease